MSLKLTIAFGENPLIRPLREGVVRPEGIELEWTVFQERGARGSETLFFRNLVEDPFDISEMGIPWTLRALERPAPPGKRDWAKLPVYLSRGTGWTGLWVTEVSGIRGPEDLVGKRIAMPEYQMSLNMWLRVMLRDFYGIRPEQNIWYCTRPKAEHQGRALGEEADEPPPPVRVHWLTEGQSALEMLDRGELDAAAIDPSRARPGMRPLFPDGGRALIARFYREQGVFQLNHHVIVQNRILAEHPWAARSLYDAFVQSRDTALERMREQRPADRAFLVETFGPDPFPQGVKAMRPSFDRYVDELMRSGALRRRFAAEEVYHSSLLDT